MENSKAIELLKGVAVYADTKFKAALNLGIAALEQQEKAFDEWCHDCKEYDKERHCCPRFSKVIRGALDEVNGNLAKARIEAEPAAAVAPVVRCKDCIHNNDCDIQYSAQAGENFFCGFGETEKDVREDVYE